MFPEFWEVQGGNKFLSHVLPYQIVRLEPKME